LSSARGRIDQLEGLEYREVPFGIKRTQTHRSGYVDTDLMIFPNAQRTYHHIGVRVPIDDTHMMRYSVFADIPIQVSSRGTGGNGRDGTLKYSSWAPSKSPADAIYPEATYRMDGVQPQDLMALETQGPIADRTREHLATSDRGVVLFRTILKREIERVQQGLDPLGVVRDQAHPPIDTYIQTWIEMTRRFPPPPEPARLGVVGEPRND
jgi:hypothetical protein